MSLARLRSILQANYSVQIVSNDQVLRRVNRRAAKRAREFIDKGETPPVAKPAAVVESLRGTRPWSIRAIDILRKIGSLTTPSWVNMAQLSASWATRRYFWAIAEQQFDALFRLSEDARQLDFHQKTLLSDEFGIGMGGLLLEHLFSAPFFVDISIALNDPSVYQNIRQVGRAQPDYLMWGRSDTSPYYVVECKGCQTNTSTSDDQLRRGLEQVPAVVLAGGPRQIVTIVVATCIEPSGTTIFALDPPGGGESDDGTKEDQDQVSERVDKRTWRIVNFERFEQRSWVANQSVLLKWAGQFHSSSLRDSELEAMPFKSDPLPDMPLETRKTPQGEFRGVSWPLFPELGERGLRLFAGVQEEFLAAILERNPRVNEIAKSFIAGMDIEVSKRQSSLSVGQDGTCLIIDGLD